MGRQRRAKYSPEFKAEAVRHVGQSDEPFGNIARDLGVNVSTLKAWVGAARPEPRDPLTEDERTELQRLRRENRQLRTERDILKKATAAFFARHRE